MLDKYLPTFNLLEKVHKETPHGLCFWLDITSFMENLIFSVAAIVQYNGHYEEDIFSICSIMTDESIGDPIDRLAVVVMLGWEDGDCIGGGGSDGSSEVESLMDFYRTRSRFSRKLKRRSGPYHRDAGTHLKTKSHEHI